jgi:hypothetical protein
MKYKLEKLSPHLNNVNLLEINTHNLNIHFQLILKYVTKVTKFDYRTK